jgi:hypothetical protein
MKNTEYILYLDLDGVLVNFERGFTDLSDGITPDEMKSRYGEKVMQNQYLAAGSSFWANLGWIEGGEDIWKASNELFERVCILSSTGTTNPIKGKPVIMGKKQWIAKNIPSLTSGKIFIVLGSHMKKMLVARNSILVDDMSSTVAEWNAYGGIGILHHHKYYQKTIQTLQDLAHPPSLTELAKRIQY